MPAVPLVDDHGCLVCGRDNPISLGLRFTVEGGRAEASVVLPELVQGWRQVAHGGAVSALLDEAMFYALAGEGWRGMTAEMTVRFLRPVPTGVALRLTAERLRLHRRFGEARAQLHLGQDLLAEADGKFLSVKGES